MSKLVQKEIDYLSVFFNYMYIYDISYFIGLCIKRNRQAKSNEEDCVFS
jgi:hypothetical protein